MISKDLILTEFPQLSHIVYLNHAGVAPWPTRTATAIKDFADENVYQGPINYKYWIAVESTLRKQLQQLLNAPSSEDIALLKNTSEGLSMIASGLDWNAGDNIVSTNQEFPSNRIVWEALQERGVALRQADLSSAESPEDALFALVDERTRMIAISSVQYATGLRMDLAQIGKFCQENGLLFCIDAIQSLGAFPLDVQAINADFVVADGHKWLLGPEGLAVFYVRKGVRHRLRPSQYGWHMVEHQGDYDRLEWEIATSARRYECGSPNMLGIHGLSASLSLLLECGIVNISRSIINNTSYLINNLEIIDNITIISNTQPERLSGIVTFQHNNISSAALHQKLLQKNVICALRAGAIRFSPHFYTIHTQLDRAIECLLEVVNSRSCD